MSDYCISNSCKKMKKLAKKPRSVSIAIFLNPTLDLLTSGAVDKAKETSSIQKFIDVVCRKDILHVIH